MSDNDERLSENGTPDLVQDDPDDGDLFGDDDDDDDDDDIQGDQEDVNRTLDDPELDSGDDLDRDDRIAATVEDEPDLETRPLKLLDATVPRINYPVGSSFYLLNMPPFLGASQINFDPDTYEPPSLPHDGDANRQTSAYSTAMSSLFWRRSPKEPSTLQSSARLVKWSDGSLTLQLATKPTEHYPISTTAMRDIKASGGGGAYDPTKDSLTFLAAPLESEVLDLHLVRALDATMKIMPSTADEDESTQRLKSLLASQAQTHDPLARMKEIKEDPEQARRAAEQFEKERVRALRKRENAEERLSLKRNAVLGRSGLGSGRSGGAGLTAAGLEDEMGMPVSRGTKSKVKRRKTNARGIIYSDDEDEGMPRRRGLEDEYDREDDFLADSDEEPEVGEGYDEDLLDDEEDAEAESDDDRGKGRDEGRRRDEGQKRKRMGDIEDEDEDDDAEGEPDDEVLARQPNSPQVRKTRRVIEDEDEE